VAHDRIKYRVDFAIDLVIPESKNLISSTGQPLIPCLIPQQVCIV